MYSLTILIIAALTAFLAGGLIGLALSHLLSGNEKRIRELEHELQDAENKLDDYQKEVTDHFSETAQLVNKLTESYKDVHEHLAGSALKLANVDMTHPLLGYAENSAQPETIEGSLTTHENIDPLPETSTTLEQNIESPLNDPFTDEPFEEIIEEQSMIKEDNNENDKMHAQIEPELEQTREEKPQEATV